ncbi:hypothetical protein RN001_001507 [Aquatica leii]|uniref:Proteasome activator complex subunit 4 n=1 Tax=Aquatica leii TaxID=1421715 RepID=A0AAN7PLA3_9COLE|nr:hypothetical protein RN001_001507 [Aquatica leii]
MEEEDTDKRLKKLGFKPQKENVYNKLLPYANELDKESKNLFKDIKTNLVKSVLAREIRPGCMVWTSRLNKYTRIYGLKFSKEDHIALVKLYYELVTIPDLEPTRINKFGCTLNFLLKKKMLSPNDLQLEWRPLYDLCVRITEKSNSDIGMYKYSSSLEVVIESLIRICRLYFPIEATQEILDEFRPHLYPYDNTHIASAIHYFELFLPIITPLEKKHLGYELWLEEFLELWKVCHNANLWENHLTWLLARLASYNNGRINWEPYIPIMFVRFKRAFHLPVSYRKRQSMRPFKIDVAAMANWMVCCLGGTSEVAFYHLEKFLQTLETYYHPANFGKWSPKLRELLKKLAFYFVQRVHCERFKKPTWEFQTSDDFKLTDADIERFVKIMKPCLEQAMFSGHGSQEVAFAMQYLAALRPDIIVPIVLDKLYTSMDSLTEPHKLTSSMICTTSIARFMAYGARNNYPEGPTHVFPLLTSLLPGIDPNDIMKCLMTFNLISHFSNLAPLVNSSEASNYYDDLTEEEHAICESSAGLEDFVLQFFDRICAWVESNSLDFVRLEQSDNENKSRLESVSETVLFSVITAMLYQCSPEIYSTALKKVHSFATNRILELKVSGKLVAILCACFAKTNPKETLKLFLPDLCGTIERLLGDNDDIIKEEQLDDELLYNLLLLSEILDGRTELLNYIDRITKILDRTLHMTSTQGSRIAAHILNLVMTSLSFTQPIEYRSCNTSYDVHIKDFLTIRKWGEPGDLKNLNLSWYVPEKAEIDCIQMLLYKYLLPELDVLDKYSKGEMVLERKELRSRLRIVSAILACQSVLPLWKEPAIQLVDSVLEPWAFELTIGVPHTINMPDGRNVRKVITDTIHNVQKKILEIDEGDTKSIYNIVYIYDILVFNKFRGRDFESHWKNFHVVKKVLEDRLHQNKSHLRYTLVDRIMLQHEFRNESRTCTFTETHKQIIEDLFELSVSHYSEVRITAQKKLFATISTFLYSYKVIIPHITKILQLDPSEHHEKFKGCLYVLLGSKNGAIVSRHDWGLIKELWPLIIKSKTSEKPSIVNLMSALTDAVNNFPTISIKFQMPDKCLTAAYELAKNYPNVSLEGFQETIDAGPQMLETDYQRKVLCYNQTIDSLLNSCLNDNLHWRYYSMTLVFLKNLVHPDIKYNPRVIQFFMNALINDSLEVRKIAMRVFLYILVQNKPKYKKITIDPYSYGSNSKANKITPGIRPDNQWLLYDSKTVPLNTEEWEKPRYLHRRDFGYYAWPKKLETYGPSHEQPTFAKRRDTLSEEENSILNFFNEQNINILIKYLSMEEKKGKDQFSGFRFLVFKNLFKIFEDHLLEHFVPHLQLLAKDGQEHSHRCIAEIIGGIMRGSKHWSFDKVQNLWSILLPIIKKIFTNMSVETLGDWGLCFATALDSRDPNRYHWLLEFLMDNPLSEQTSFSSCCRIYILQNALNQQAWRNVELISRLLEYLKGHLSHPFQNVRENISVCLTVIFSENIGFSNGCNISSPKVEDFFTYVMPRLNTLYDITVDSMRKNEGGETTQIANQMQLIHLNNNGEKEERIRLFKTVSKYVTGSVTRRNYAAVPSHYELLPLACILQNNDNDEELSTICSNFLAVIGHSLILKEYIPAALAAIEKVSVCPFWSARAAIAEFIPVFVFHNFSTVIANEEWVDKIKMIVLQLLEDIQPEVRVTAAKTLSGFLHCHFIPNADSLLSEFKLKSRTKLKSRSGSTSSTVNIQNNSQTIRTRHAAVLGMCAFVSCHPYDVPEYLSDIFLELGKHLNDPQPIPAAIHQTLGDFKRTHHDNWDVHKLKFTEDELAVLSDLTVPPSYYA